MAALPLAFGRSRSAGVLEPGPDGFVELHARPAIVSLLGPDRPLTPVWAYDGVVAGPAIRVRHGEEVRVRLFNELDEPTTIHWHGVRIDNRMDGVPGLTQEEIAPGESFDYVFTPPDAGTYWYHSHRRTYVQVDKGLYGPLIVEERDPIGVDRDLMLVIDDWRLLDNGCIDEASFGDRREWAREGRLGNVFTANGTTNARFAARRGERVRIRCVNGCNSGIFSFDIFRIPLLVIAWDGQMLAEPVRRHMQPISLSPGQRVDFVIEIGDDAPPEVDVRLYSSGLVHKVATLEVEEGAAAAPGRRPLALRPSGLTPPDLAHAVHVPLRMHGGSESTQHRGGFDMRTFRESGQFWRFNNVSGGEYHGFGQAAPLFDVPVGRTVVIDMYNDSFFSHAMHFHGHHFRVVEKNGVAAPDEPWRDVELIGAEERMSIAMVADNPGRWLYHCHMAEHHAAGMGGWFNVAG